MSVKFRDSAGDLSPFMDLMSTKSITLNMNIVRGAESFWLRTATGSALFLDAAGFSKSVGDTNTVRGLITYIRRPQ